MEKRTYVALECIEEADILVAKPAHKRPAHGTVLLRELLSDKLAALLVRNYAWIVRVLGRVVIV